MAIDLVFLHRINTQPAVSIIDSRSDRATLLHAVVCSDILVSITKIKTRMIV